MIKEIKSAEIVCLTAVNTFCSAHRKLTEFLSRHLYTFVCLIAPRPSPEQHHCAESISSLCNNNYLLPLSNNTALLSSTSAAVFEGKTDQTAISGRSELISQGLRYIESSTVTFNLRDLFFVFCQWCPLCLSVHTGTYCIYCVASAAYMFNRLVAGVNILPPAFTALI